MFPAMIEQTRRMVRALDPGTLTDTEARTQMEQFAELERLAAAGKTVLAARVADGDSWRGADRSPAHWLARQTGTTVGAARETIATSTRLNTLPTTAGAVRDGKLSAEQAAIVSEAASVDPDAEQELLSAAPQESVRELQRRAERVMAAKRSAEEEREREDKIRRSRRVYVTDLPDGSAELRARGNKVDIAKLRARLQPWIDEQFTIARNEGRRESLDAYAFDALMAMSAGTTSGTKPKSPAKMLIRVDLSAIRRGTTEAGELCEIAGFGPIPVSEAIKLMPEALLTIVCTDGKPVNVTHLKRKFTAHQETALEWTSIECDVLGCYCTARLQKDHNTDWAKTRVTRDDDANRLCPWHHRLKTLFGYQLEPGRGKRRFLPPERAPGKKAA